jgi:hypothetical protein
MFNAMRSFFNDKGYLGETPFVIPVVLRLDLFIRTTTLWTIPLYMR